MQLVPDQIFAEEYRVIGELGRGGMGAVYLVEQKSTEKRRALKLMDARLLTDDEAARRFLLEARVGAKIESEHVVEVLAAGIDRSKGQPVPWLVMELLEGSSLEDAIAEHGPMDPVRAHEVFRQLCHGLGAAHRAGLVHRDVKPDNIFLADSKSATQRMKVKLLDFGIAKVLQPTVGGQGSATAPMGTPMFMAPEQTRHGGVDARADVWALGLVAYYVLTGKHYWRAANEPNVALTALLVEISVDPIDPPSVRAASQGTRVPDGFDEWFLGCVDRDIERRYANADAAWRGLSGRLSGEAFAATVGAAQLDSMRPASDADRAAPGARTEPAASTESRPSSGGLRDGDRSAGGPDTSATETPKPSPVEAHASSGSASSGSGARLGLLAFGAGAVMLVVGGVAVGWSMQRGGDPAPPPVDRVVANPPADDDPPMVPMAPRPEPSDEGADPTATGADPTATPVEHPDTADEGATEDEAADDDEPAAPDRAARRARLSPEDRRARDQFVEAAQLGCRTWLASQPQPRVRVHLRQWLHPDGRRIRWQVRPEEIGACLVNRAAYVRWPGTGEARTVDFAFTLRRP